MRKMYERKYPRREGEALWRYNRRISYEMAQDMVRVIDAIQVVVDVITVLIKKVLKAIPAILATVILVASILACLIFGGDDQCVYKAGSNGVQNYECLTHGFDCPEND